MEQEIKSVFDLQQKHKFDLRKTDVKTRIGKLRLLKHALEKAEEEIFSALEKDLHKNRFESAVTELYFTYAEIDFAVKKLKSWMRPKSAGRTMSNVFSSNKIYYEPKGVCLIIAPWNYPLQLMMSPLVSALAAGNCVILKPSELSEATAGVISKLIATTFEPKEIACFEGDADISTELLKLPFDHIFFTGSTTIGKVVMEAAAKNLTSVTLELGGKSPAIVDGTCDIKKAAEKIAWGKLVNAGQTCIAPDYVLIEENRLNDFVGHYKAAVQKLFFEGVEINKNDYAKIINDKQFKRINKLKEDAIADGAVLTFGGEADEQNLTLMPTLLTSVKENSAIMQEEIFGPILPVITFKNLQEAIEVVNSKNKPLALYIFSANKQHQHKIINETSAGGTCVNDVLVHISNPNLPFGGVNSSGMGSCHGIFGFKTFSHERAVVFQSKLGLTKMIYPPYAPKMGLLKWLKKLM
jgi:aldehyde dehydrogenase (NAD+)